MKSAKRLVGFTPRRGVLWPCLLHHQAAATIPQRFHTKAPTQPKKRSLPLIDQGNLLSNRSRFIGSRYPLLAPRVSVSFRGDYQVLARRQVRASSSLSPLDDDGSTTNQKKHKWTKRELTHLVNGLVSLIRGENAAQSLNNKWIPTRETLNANFCFDVLEACMEIAKETHDIRAAHQARLLLTTMQEIQDKSSLQKETPPNWALSPKIQFYDVVLQSYAVCRGGAEAAFAAQSILETMLRRCRTCMEATAEKCLLLLPPPEPTVKTFNIVVNAWAKSGQRQAGERAQVVVQMMHEWNVECCNVEGGTRPRDFKGVTPNVRTLVSLVDAWSRSRHPKAPERATSILWEAIKESKNDSSITLHPILFHVVLGAWVNSQQGRRGAEMAEKILSVMEECAASIGRSLLPGTRAYALVMTTWMRCEQVEKNGSAAARAEFLLRFMIDTYRKERAPYIKPNKRCFTTCISAWSRAHRQTDAPERAEALLNVLIELYNETQDHSFRPDNGLYNAVITAWTRATDRPDSMEKAKTCLQSLRKYTEPNLVSFNAILDGMGKRGMGEEALRLLEWLEQMGQDSPELLPDILTYNSTLSALARDRTSSRPWEKTLELLRKMEGLAGESAGRQISPDSVSYTVALGAWIGTAQIDLEDVLQAQELLQRSIRNHQELGWKCNPDSYSFSSMIQVCKNVTGTESDCERALDIALEALEECSSGGYGDRRNLPYAPCLQAVNQLCADDVKRGNTLKKIFDKCCETGDVSKGVVGAMKLGAWKGEAPRLQAAWSRRVPLRDKPVEVSIREANM